MKRFIIPTLGASILCIALGLPSTSRATNMRVGPIVTPSGIILLQQSIFLQYLMRNDSLYAASNVKSYFTVRDALTNEIVFQNQTVTPFIAAYTVLYVQSSLAWIPQYAGRFRITVELEYDQDVIPGDNASSKEFRVEVPPVGVFNFYRYTLLSPFFSPFSQYGSFRLSTPAAPATRWLNVVAWRNDSTPFWIARNLPIPATGKAIEYEHDIDLTGIVQPEVQQDSITVSITVTDTTWNTVTNELLKQGFILEHDSVTIGMNDEPVQPGMTSPPAATYPTMARSPVLRETILRDTVPNIDLDSTVHNANTTLGYAGDFNACVPTAIANSMQWLENFEDALPQSLAIREKLKLLSALCERERSAGVHPLPLVRAKQHYVDSLKIPLHVKFQANNLWIPKDSASIASPIPRFGHSAANQSAGAGRVSMDWIVQEMKDNEDVELSFKYFDTVANEIKGGHCVNVTGVITDNDKLRGLWYQDDIKQTAPGGTAQRYVSVDDNVDPRGPVLYGNQFGHRRFIHAAFSESYDPTVKFEEPQGGVGMDARQIPQLHAGVNNGVLFIASLPERTETSTLKLLDLPGRTVLERSVLSGVRLLHVDLAKEQVARGSYLLILEDVDSVIATTRIKY